MMLQSVYFVRENEFVKKWRYERLNKEEIEMKKTSEREMVNMTFSDRKRIYSGI